MLISTYFKFSSFVVEGALDIFITHSFQHGYFNIDFTTFSKRQMVGTHEMCQTGEMCSTQSIEHWDKSKYLQKFSTVGILLTF